MNENRILSILQENYDHTIVHIEFLRRSGGTTYIVHGKTQKYFLKIAGQVFLDTIRQSGLTMLEISEEGQEYLLVLYEYIEGKEPDLCLCCEKVGDLVGRLHKLLLAYSGELIERDYSFFIERYINILRRKNYQHTDAYANLGARLWERVKGCPVGVCHGVLNRLYPIY